MCVVVLSVVVIVAFVDCDVFPWYTMAVIPCICGQTHVHPVLDGKERGKRNGAETTTL